MKKTKQQLKKGFSLVEMLVVITIIGILTGVLYTSYNKYISQAKITVAKTEMLQITEAFEAAMVGNNNVYRAETDSVAVDNFRTYEELSTLDVSECYETIADTKLKEGSELSFDGTEFTYINDGVKVVYNPVEKKWTEAKLL